MTAVTHRGRKNEDNCGIRGVFERLPSVQVSESWLFVLFLCLLIYDERINVHLKLLQAEVQRALGSYFPSLVCSKAEGQLEKQTQKHSVPLSVSH